MTTAPLTTTDRNLDAACAAVAGEIARTDSKASLLLAFTGAVLAGLASIADNGLPLVTKTIGALAVLALAVAAVLLLLVVRPNLGGGRVVREGLPYWARLEERELRAAMTEDTRAARVKALSGLAVAKYRRLARAVDLILIALALLALAAIGALA
ncbi:Pycsar system effector family protein [Streptomyces sp. NPDC006638]|uniref:Pycsar system effector family protein n=1 Tax=Streptomyces sp. NPDC006638 TaxID=3157183 RepID=UPI0033BAD262